MLETTSLTKGAPLSAHLSSHGHHPSRKCRRATLPGYLLGKCKTAAIARIGPLRPDIDSAARALRNGPQLVLDRLPRRWRGDTSDEQPQREVNLKQGHWYPHNRGDRTAEESCEL